MEILKYGGLLLLAVIWIKFFISVFSDAVNNLRKAKARNINGHCLTKNISGSTGRNYKK